MLFIISLCILLITYIHSIKDVITLLYYNDTLYEIDRSSKNCSEKSFEFNKDYNNMYKYSIILDIIMPISKYVNESDTDFDIRKNKRNTDILSNPIAKDFYYFLSEKNINNIYDYYNAVSGTLLGLFVLFIVIINIIKIKSFKIHIFENILLYCGIFVYLLTYIILFSILSEKIKQYRYRIETEYYINTDKIKFDFEEFRKLIYYHVFLILIIIILLMSSYKKLYGDHSFYQAYGVAIFAIIVIYMLYFIYNQFVV